MGDGGEDMTGTMTVFEVETDVPTAVARIEQALQHLGVTVFARLDHAAAARAAGLELPDQVVLAFGDPAAGTLLMQVRQPKTSRSDNHATASSNTFPIPG